MNSLSKIAIAGLSTLVLILSFQNCSKSGGEGTNTDSVEGSSGAADSSIALKSVDGGVSILDCNIEYSATHPAGDIEIEIYWGETLYGTESLGALEATENREGTINCKSVELFPLTAGNLFDFSLALKVDGEAVGDRSNIILYDVSRPVSLGTDVKYERRGHVIYLYSDYTHCKYPKVDRSSGVETSEENFQKILDFSSGGTCNGSYNGTGVEPTDWTFPALSSTILTNDQAYRIDGNNVIFASESLCFMDSNSVNIPGLIDADALQDGDPQKTELLLLLRQLYRVRVDCP